MSLQTASQTSLPASPHLSDEQISQYLVDGDALPEVTAHLADCQRCREELAVFGVSMDAFNDVSLAWSQSQPAGRLQERLRREARTEAPRRALAVASWALCASLAVAAGISIGNHERAHELTARPAVAVAGDNEAQIERDNRLLFAVAEATSVKTASPLEEYGLGLEPAAQESLKGKNRHDRNFHE